jgi:hypothetical protein
MAKSYERREDGEYRAAIAIWVHPTQEQVAAIDRIAAAANLSEAELLAIMAEDAIERAIGTHGAGLPINRERWPGRRA